jgi:hypothetical protein
VSPHTRSACRPAAHTPRPSLITSSYNGFDGSLMNGLQVMDTWQDFFDHPTGGRLGILNAIQVSRYMHASRFPLQC